jgi:hypothetical protein
MKKDFAVITLIFLCVPIALVFPQVCSSHPMVNEDGCRVCHELGDFSLEGLHGTHLDCFACHDGPPELGNVNSSVCLACHPRPEGEGETCDLVVYHEGNPNYEPAVATCLSMGCHSDDCSDVPITTTTPSTTTAPTTTCPSTEIYGEGSLAVTRLRAFRDNLLSQTPEGQELIKLYYQWSPVIVKTMETDEAFKEELKTMIDELLPLIDRAVE